MAMNIADLFEHAADAFPERVAVICGERQVTYRELEQRANRLAHHLAGIGVGPGNHVGLYARNSIEAIETLIAVCKLRAETSEKEEKQADPRTDISSLTSMLEAKWKGGQATGAPRREPVRAGQIRSFRIVKLDAAGKRIELELA